MVPFVAKQKKALVVSDDKETDIEVAMESINLNVGCIFIYTQYINNKGVVY